MMGLRVIEADTPEELRQELVLFLMDKIDHYQDWADRTRARQERASAKCWIEALKIVLLDLSQMRIERKTRGMIQ